MSRIENDIDDWFLGGRERDADEEADRIMWSRRLGVAPPPIEETSRIRSYLVAVLACVLCAASAMSIYAAWL
jgi:hypothetical protein